MQPIIFESPLHLRAGPSSFATCAHTAIHALRRKTITLAYTCPFTVFKDFHNDNNEVESGLTSQFARRVVQSYYKNYFSACNIVREAAVCAQCGGIVIYVTTMMSRGLTPGLLIWAPVVLLHCASRSVIYRARVARANARLEFSIFIYWQKKNYVVYSSIRSKLKLLLFYKQ